MKILIVKPSSLGDVIQALPAAVELKRHLPESRIDWAVFEAYQNLLEGHPALHTVYPLLKPSRKQGWGNSLNRDLVARIREQQYDIVLDLQGLLRSALITARSGARRRIGLVSAREGARFFYNELVEDTRIVSAVGRYLAAAAYVTGSRAPAVPDYQLSASPSLRTRFPEKQYVVFHPYTRWSTKIWPWRYYQSLVNQMPQQPVVVVGNGPWFPLEGELVQDLRGALSIKELLGVLGGAKAVVTTDSGPAHLAAALTIPVVALFGPTDPHKTGPCGQQVTILNRELACAPCLKKVCHNPEIRACLTGIPPEAVREKLKKYLS